NGEFHRGLSCRGRIPCTHRRKWRRRGSTIRTADGQLVARREISLCAFIECSLCRTSSRRPNPPAPAFSRTSLYKGCRHARGSADDRGGGSIYGTQSFALRVYQAKHATEHLSGTRTMRTV